MKSLVGTGVALVTPFKKDFSVDTDALKRIVRYNIDGGIEYLVVLGTTAESATLSKEEKELVIKTIVEENAGALPLVLGVGGNNTQEVVNELKTRDLSNFKAILSVSPYYNKPTQEGIYQHFKMVAENSPISVILYNVPGRTGCPLTYEAVERLSRHPNIVGIKEASGDISLVSKIARLISDDFKMYSGNDDMIVPLLSLGGAGVISVLANILPRETHEMVAAFHGGNIERARDLQLHYLDFINALFIETNPIPIKEAMNATGMNVGAYRLPLYPMEDNTKAYLMGTMRQVGFSIGEVRGQTAK